MDQPAPWWRSGSVVVANHSTIQEYALQRLADRLAGVENALMKRLSAEADLQSSRAQVTPTSGCPPDCRPYSSGRLSGACCLLLRHSQRHEHNLWTVVLSRSWTTSSRSERAGTTWAAVLQNYISNANADMHTEMTAVERKTAVTHNVAVINPDSVARSKSLHFSSRCWWKVLLLTSS